MVALYQFCTNGALVQNHLIRDNFFIRIKVKHAMQLQWEKQTFHTTPIHFCHLSICQPSWSHSYQDGRSSLCPWTWTVRSISGSSCPGGQQLARLHNSNQQDIIACLPTHACMYVVSRQSLFSASVLLLSAPVCLAHEINLHDVCAQEWFDTHFKPWCWAGPDQTLALKYIVVL